LLEKAKKLTTTLQEKSAENFGGEVTLSHTLRRAIQLGVIQIDHQINGVKNGK
tara:strand:- start:5481 stop:5639 length:159 start_codon:yes stop_codon:yes gene_type:complete